MLGKKRTVLCKLLGIGCLCFGGVPSVAYRIIHTGTIALLLLGIFLLLYPSIWSRMGKRSRRILLVLLATGLTAAFVLSSAMAKAAWFSGPPEKGVDVVVVLGAKVRDNQPSLLLRYRLDTAREYLERHPQAICVVSGGQGVDEPVPEAVVMAEYLQSKGISQDRILQEASSTNTRENLLFTKTLLSEKGIEQPSVLIVTNDFHQFRADLYGKMAGFTHRYALSAISPWGLFPSYWIREWPAICNALLIA